MAAGSLLAALLRRSRFRSGVLAGDRRASLLENPRLLSSVSEAPAIEEEFPFGLEDDLRSRIFRLRFPKRSATAVLDKWIGEGRKVTAPELRRITEDLRRSLRYKHALEILTWMDSQGSFRVSAPDHATRLDLIAKVHSLTEAEVYFDKISESISMKAASFPLLHNYVKERDIEKAEALMEKLQNLGLTVDPHPFNEMMKLYMATGQFKKVLAVIRLMKCSLIPRNVLSYSLWMNAYCELSDVASVEMVHKEMVNDKNVEVGWSTYSTLANVYTKYGLIDGAIAALRAAEEKLSGKKRLGYFFVMTIYASLNDRDGVLRLWHSSKRVPGRATCANYMCVMLCLVKVGDIAEAEKIFRTWESECRKYDIRVSNVLLGAYMRNGWMEAAESLHMHTLERGACPNYKTWEIMMEGWVKNKQMGKAVEAMKKCFSMLRNCEWRPSSHIVIAIAEHFEKQGSVGDANKLVKVLRRFRLMSLPLYKSFLRAHIKANVAAPDILKEMARDNIELDEEISILIRRTSQTSSIDNSHE